jgi:hypothetical protein
METERTIHQILGMVASHCPIEPILTKLDCLQPKCAFIFYVLSIGVYNATFNTILVISWPSVLLGEETNITRSKSLTCHKSQTNFKTQNCIAYTSLRSEIELTT